jgi:flagellar biosynthesis/type III secretory pathway protein FliH
MTLSFDAVTRPPTSRGGRVLRGVAVERALPAHLNVEEAARAGLIDRRKPQVEQLDDVRQQGFDDGYRAGLEAARSSSEATRDDAVRRGAEAIRLASEALRAGRANAIAVVERDAASLAVELTRALVDHELSVSDDEVAATVRRALRLTAPGEDLVVRLHPDEVVGADMLQPLVTDCKITVVGDADVEPGGCVIDAGPCRIDAQIEPALARVKLALLSGRTPETTIAPRPSNSALDQAWGGW